MRWWMSALAGAAVLGCAPMAGATVLVLDTSALSEGSVFGVSGNDGPDISIPPYLQRSTFSRFMEWGSSFAGAEASALASADPATGLTGTLDIYAAAVGGSGDDEGAWDASAYADAALVLQADAPVLISLTLKWMSNATFQLSGAVGDTLDFAAIPDLTAPPADVIRSYTLAPGIWTLDLRSHALSALGSGAGERGESAVGAVSYVISSVAPDIVGPPASSPPLPEPQVWAMLIGGLFGVGVALRRSPTARRCGLRPG